VRRSESAKPSATLALTFLVNGARPLCAACATIAKTLRTFATLQRKPSCFFKRSGLLAAYVIFKTKHFGSSSMFLKLLLCLEIRHGSRCGCASRVQICQSSGAQA